MKLPSSTDHTASSTKGGTAPSLEDSLKMVHSMNIFRVLADGAHALSKLVLIFSIHWNRSAEGISLLFQSLYTLVFLTRYLDLLWTPPFQDFYLSFMKIAYIATSFYTLYLMLSGYPRSRELEWSWHLAAYLSGFVLSAFGVTALAQGLRGLSVSEVLWTFSIMLESVCVLPQLSMLRQTSVPTVIDSGYIILLGSYRAFYILNWILRAGHGYKPDPIAVVFGVLQTVLYADFAWVYYTRQRVKLRAGVVVDGDDLRKSFLVGKILGQGSRGDADRSEDGAVDGWGRRNVSVSADDEPVMPQRTRVRPEEADRLALLEEMEEEEELTMHEEDSEPHKQVTATTESDVPGMSDGEEWRK